MSATLPVLHLRILLVVRLIAVTSLSVPQLANAQATAPGEWTWVGGSDQASQPGVYGTLGVPSPGNIPGSRIKALSWTDSSGNLWLFGGQSPYGNGNWDNLNDLWEFKPSTNEWTWMGGSSTAGSNCTQVNGSTYCGQPGVYGTLGTPAAGNFPGSHYSASSWTDSGGDLWFFGGCGFDVNGDFGCLNDLWEFNPSTNEWAWIGGSNSAHFAGVVYGTLETPAAGNNPGGRVSAASWTDRSGHFWLFGGRGGNDLNDLWEYNPSTNEWTWMSGSSTTGSNCAQIPGFTICGQSGMYGTLGTAAPGNVPGGREDATNWTDRSGHLWLLGGNGFDASGNYGSLNDLWEFNPSTNQWAWMGGSSTAGSNCTQYYGQTFCGQSGEYGTLGRPASSNTPGGRNSITSWTDSNGNLWLFGGSGFDSMGNYGGLNDLWEFNPSTNLWTWMGGSSTIGSNGGQPGEYGTLGTPAAGNIPGGRANSTNWTDSSGNFWLFGGLGFDAIGSGFLNDLWEYQPSATILPAAATPAISLPAGSYTAAQTVILSDATAAATIYYTTDGTTPTTASTVYSRPITVSSTETIEAIATAGGYSQSAVASATYTINLPQAATPNISVAAGSYTAAQTVILSDATAAATIYYTTDGTTPTMASTVYSGPITVSSTETLEAMATASGYLSSVVATAVYTVNISTNPTPFIGSISPATASAGGAAFTLTINGLEFTASSTVYWGTTALSTTYVNATQLTAQVTAADIATAGAYAITVQTPAPGGGTSNSLQFEVDSTASTATPPTFTSTTAIVATGSTASYPVTLPSTVTTTTVSCLNLPTGASCSYSATANTVTITTSPTTPAGTYQVTVVFNETVSGAATSWILLPILLLPLMILRKRLAARGAWVTACLGLVLLAGTAFCAGCGGGGGGGNSGGGGGGDGGGTQTHQVTSSSVVSLTIK
jgi:N-acetylneuraminic acid mutarotase